MKSKDESAVHHAKEQEVIAAKAVQVDLPPGPSHEEIQQRAYQLHLERGGGHGQDLEDWLQAERELKSNY